MSVNEKDIEELESYLDGELSTEESAALAGRLSREPTFQALAEELRDARAARVATFAAGEPSAAAAAALNDRIFAAADLYGSAIGQSRRMRWIGAAAACLIAGFVGGYAIRGSDVAPTSPNGVSVAANPAVVANPSYSNTQTSNGLRLVGPLNAPTQFVNYTTVPVRDAAGRVVGSRLVSDEQSFHEFLNSGGANPAGRPVAPNIKLVGDEKDTRP